MAKKILLIILLLLTQNVTSQEDTIVRIPLKTANAIINDLEELDSLKHVTLVQGLIIGKYKAVNLSLEFSLDRKDVQIELLKSNYKIVTDKEKNFWDKLLNTLKDIGIGSAIFAVGFVIGSL